MAASTCRICLGKAEHPHYCALFSKKSLEGDLPARISELSGVSIGPGDGYPERICRSCKSRFDSLEKGLDEFRQRAQTSYGVYSRKRSCESMQSPNSVSVRCRPPTKRSRARCLFPDGSSELTKTVQVLLAFHK